MVHINRNTSKTVCFRRLIRFYFCSQNVSKLLKNENYLRKNVL